MRTLSLAVVVCLASASDVFAACAPTRMLRIVTAIEAPGVPPDHFASQPKTVYRFGNKYGRVEEVLNRQTNTHLLVIVSEPDVWMVNRVNMNGQHMVDRGPSLDFRAPVLTSSKSEFWKDLEFGCEEAFMKKAGAQPENLAEGRTRYTHTAEGIKATLLVSPKKRPERLEAESSEGRFAVKYLSYEDTDFQPGLFARPDGVRLSER